MSAERDRWGQQVLEQFVPVLRYDSHETFFAAAVEIMADANDAFILTRGSGEMIASGPVSAQLLGAEVYGNGKPVREGDRLTGMRRDYREQARALHRQPALRNVVYGHVQTDSEGRLWLQYWYFYLYNDASFAGNSGLHEGDWEMVQLRLAGDKPDVAVYAQHEYAEQRAWEDVELEGISPVVYSGRGTHASYFEPGLHRTAVWWDIVDGMRPAPPHRLVVLDADPPSWLAWPGRWGASHPRIPEIDCWSPVGPAHHDHWQEPKKLASRARGHERQRPPPAPSLRVRRQLGHLALGFELEAPVEGLDRPIWLMVTVDSPGGQAPPSTQTFGLGGVLRGRLLTAHELDPGSHYVVHTSVGDIDRKGTAAARFDLPALGHLGRVTAGLTSLLYDLRLAFSPLLYDLREVRATITRLSLEFATRVAQRRSKRRSW